MALEKGGKQRKRKECSIQGIGKHMNLQFLGTRGGNVRNGGVEIANGGFGYRSKNVFSRIRFWA